MGRFFGNIIAIVLTLLALVRLAHTDYNGFQNHKAGMVVDDVVQMITDAHAGLPQSNNGYASFTTASVPVMINGSMFPIDMVRGDAVVDPWGNPVTFTSTNNASQDVVGFDDGGSETASQRVKVVTSVRDYVSLNINGQVFTQANLPDQVTTGATCGATTTFSMTFR